MPKGQYNPQNETAVCDDPSPLLMETMVAAQKVIAANAKDAEDAAMLLWMCGVFPGREEIEERIAKPMDAHGRI